LDTRPSGESRPHLEVLWLAGEGGMEADLIRREQVPFETIPAAGVHGVGWRQLPKNLWQIAVGTLAARRILHRFQPDVMLYTGGYMAVPAAIAGRIQGARPKRPANLLYVPDIEPGLALKTLARFADRIALTAEESMPFFSNSANLIVTGYPARQDLRVWTLDQAHQSLGLNADLFTLLVFGGSKGARSINRALFAILPDLLEDIQIVHISGHLDWNEVEAARLSLETRLVERYHAFPYLHGEMGAALKAADLVVSRAGASVLGEYPLFGLPAILIPYPYAWRYQEVNARYLEQRGAAQVLEDADLQGHLHETIQVLLRDQGRRMAMGQAMRSLAHPDAAQKIASQVWELAIEQAAGRN
jgi:UDP-N-acetylglucosamine--N-acetylmuramyl-(pentapeptide) pyrophosphoryl-undecaprenol N-acetylglucosamine transferase